MGMSRCARTPPARLPMMPRSTCVRCVIGIAYVTPGAGTPTCTHTPPHSRHMHGLLGDRGMADALERPVDAAGAERAVGHLGREGSSSWIASTGLVSAGVDEVRGAELEGELALGGACRRR